MAPSETMKLPWLCMPGGTGSLRPPVFVSSQNSSSPAGTQIGGGASRQPGSRASSGPGSITAPERICAPKVEAFSITHTVVSGWSCFSRVANDSPAGPAPTTTTSYSMVSRSLIAFPGVLDARLERASRYGSGPPLSEMARGAATRAARRRSEVQLLQRDMQGGRHAGQRGLARVFGGFRLRIGRLRDAHARSHFGLGQAQMFAPCLHRTGAGEALHELGVGHHDIRGGAVGALDGLDVSKCVRPVCLPPRCATA